MLAEIAAQLKTEIEGLGLFDAVSAGLRMSESAYPAADVFLKTETLVQDRPQVYRELDWTVQITTWPQDDTPAGDLAALALIDAVRDLFSDYRLPGHGSTPATVPEIKLAEFDKQRGLIYLVTVRLRVMPQTFSLT